MEIVIDTHLLWNLMITFVLAPLGFLIRNLLSAQKRIDILVNKTREELAKEYVTREEVEIVSERLIATMNRIDEKIDRLQSKTYFQE